MLSVLASGAEPLTYQWQFDRVNLPGATSSTLVIPSIQRNQAGRYRVLVSSSDGSLYSLDTVVSVTAPLVQTSFADGALVLRWDGIATLQSATNAVGPFEDVPGAISPVTISPVEAQRYFRLKR